MTDITQIETAKLVELETIIERGLQTFFEVGNALREIRDSRLYRAEFGTFEEYCQERWEMERAHAYRLIDAAQVVENLSPMGDIPKPTGERQARALARLTPQLQREVWPLVINTAPNGKITTTHIQQVVNNYAKAFNYKRDIKSTRPIDIYTPQGYDACQTPAYAIDPLLPHLIEGWNIWEPACGEGYLEDALYDSGFNVIPTDIILGQNFFDFEPEIWDCLITNPPFSLKYKFLERCYQLGRPFALLMPVEALGTESAAILFEQFGVEVIFIRPRINFKMPNKGWEGAGAQFPVAWFTWGLEIGKEITFAKVVPGS